ncbi:hypothetical protein [Emticicia fluvialis]|uniref:hypothetical protein n=1 Tax=Emticicia fluvialis TaxID=2974474 RepID=UPI002165863D|nr:hypothetical protein [Emticicia fluvialis]
MKTIFAILASCLVLSCNQSEKTNKDSLKIEKADSSSNKIQKIAVTQADKLKLAFEQKDYPAFFKEFPDNFKDFVDLYGYDDSTGAKLLYNEDEHIYFLFNAPKEYFNALNKKAVNVAIGGKWDADAIGFFHEGVNNLIIKHPKEILAILEKKSDKDAAGFWRFAADSAFERYNDNMNYLYTMYEIIKPLNSKQAEILKKEYDKLYI